MRAIALLTVLSLIAPATFAATPASKPAVEKLVIPVFTLRGPMMESDGEDMFLFGPKPATLRDVTRRMRDAGDDESIKAVVVLTDNFMAGLAQLEELRSAMKHLRDKGKDVLVHSDSMRLGGYVLFSGASRVSVVPHGDLWITGLHGESLYIRGLLDKIGVTPDFLHCGAYKSAGEMFTRTGPSPEADEMHNWLFDSIYANSIDSIATGRNVSIDKVKGWIDVGMYTAERAKELGLIDAVEQRQDFDAYLKTTYGQDLTYDRKYGEEKGPELDFSSPFAMFKIWADMLGGGQKEEPNKPAVGIVYVDGMILPGKGERSPFGGSGGAFSSDIRKALDDATRDEKVKAVVLRIDSPGGSAVASEIILDATRRVKARKPLVVSMGNVAGSGGYYVACAGGTIFADPSTITASIGVVSGKLVTTDMWTKIGVSWKPYSRGKNADMLASDRPFTDEQKQLMQSYMDEIYDVFKQHVVDARGNKLKKPIDDLAAGRVFTGKQALDLGLVDKMGTLNDAIAFAASEAKLDDYDVRVVPKSKNFLEMLMEDSGGKEDEADQKWITADSSLPASPLRSATASRQTSLLDLAMPHLEHLDPTRVSAIRQALMKLQLLDREGVLMVMPEGFVWD